MGVSAAAARATLYTTARAALYTTAGLRRGAAQVHRAARSFRTMRHDRVRACVRVCVLVRARLCVRTCARYRAAHPTQADARHACMGTRAGARARECVRVCARAGMGRAWLRMCVRVGWGGVGLVHGPSNASRYCPAAMSPAPDHMGTIGDSQGCYRVLTGLL